MYRMLSLKFCLAIVFFSVLSPMTGIASEETWALAQADSRVLILDFGSQYSHLIARRVRELGMYSFVMPADVSLARIKDFQPKAVILSGGPFSVYDDGAPALDGAVYRYLMEEKLPILGICYGMQYLSQQLGGKVKSADNREYGRACIKTEEQSTLFAFMKESQPFHVWMSHGDEVITLPQGFAKVATSDNNVLVAIENVEQNIYLIQFHPEVTHTEMGTELLNHFLSKIACVKATCRL